VEPDLSAFGTLGTGNRQLRACAREDTSNIMGELKDSETAVPNVPRCLEAAMATADRPPEKLPYPC